MNSNKYIITFHIFLILISLQLSLLTGCLSKENTNVLPTSNNYERQYDSYALQTKAEGLADESKSSSTVAAGTAVPLSPSPVIPGTHVTTMPIVQDGLTLNQLSMVEVTPDSTITSPVVHNTESYDVIRENEFLDVTQVPLSTFSIDVDTASYSNLRRNLNYGHQPPKGSVRIEEMVNYFPYNYPQPQGNVPFSVNVDIADCPWNPEHRLARIGLKGKEIHLNERPPCNLVFLIDVSGSMSDSNKLPLVKESMKLLVEKMTDKDKIGIVVYASDSGIHLKSTSDKDDILDAIDDLEAEGSTNAGSGIQDAYKLAKKHFIKDGINRVILATDGDFNVGITSRSELLALIEEQSKSNIFLTVLGFGMGNYKDDSLELLADKGNGNYGYIDTLNEAKKILVDQMSGTLITIAKDVKIQVEFNPTKILQYRLIGYENRLLQAKDFNDDKKDAGEIGAGHTVTAFYEIVPVGAKKVEINSIDPLKYQTTSKPSDSASISNEVMTVKLRYKLPDQDVSSLLEFPIKDEQKEMKNSSKDFMFASSVVCFGMILNNSKYKGEMTFDLVKELAEEGQGKDPEGYRKEFIELVNKAKKIFRK